LPRCCLAVNAVTCYLFFIFFYCIAQVALFVCNRVINTSIGVVTINKPDTFQVELEKKLDASNREKARYRQQLERAISKLAAAQKKEKDAAKAQLLKEKRELEHMRLRYLAAEEKKVISSERRELEDLKNELMQYVNFFFFVPRTWPVLTS
jgi:hypothetical protein